ncbi:MAG: hypothetical protein FD163_869 [Hyphomonadaceae bacterium]|nr:MAG: hypothetical protein FD163_869 [Hyphomonadaceae bacterium]
MSRIISLFTAAIFAAFCFAVAMPASAQFANTQAGPQTGLAKSRLTIATPNGVRTFTVELANTANSREIGMMWRAHVGRGEGMLFQFPTAQRMSFWMKNTMIPLDIIYIRANGTISQINRNAVPFSLTPIPGREPCIAVLEIGGGEAARQGLAVGQVIRHPIFRNVAPAVVRKKRR